MRSINLDFLYVGRPASIVGVFCSRLSREKPVWQLFPGFEAMARAKPTRQPR